jgi:hypothetical protein
MKRVLGLGLFLGLSGCQSLDSLGFLDTVDSQDIDEDLIWGEYTLVYNEDLGEFEFTAQFHVRDDLGASVRLSEPSQVTLDGEAMDFYDHDLGDNNSGSLVFSAVGSHYYLNRSTQFEAGFHAFVWTRLDGTEITNVVETARPVAITTPAMDETVSRSTPLIIEIGGGLELNETVECRIGSEGVTVSSGCCCEFSVAQLSTLTPGPATLRIIRHLEQELQAGHEKHGGSVRSVYVGSGVAITVN